MHTALTGWRFPKFSIGYSYKTVNVIIIFICQGSFHINSNNITGHQRTVTISEIHKTLFF